MRQTYLLRPGILADTPSSSERATLAAIAPEYCGRSFAQQRNSG